MKNTKIENGKIFLNNGYGTTYVFEIVEKIPTGFEIWNIGELGEYIPVCRTVNGSYNVDISTLKAIKLSESEVITLNRAAGSGVKTLKIAKNTLSRVAKSAGMKRKQLLAEKAFPILEKITA